MAPGMHGPDVRQNLTGCYVSILAYLPITARQTREYRAQFLSRGDPGL